MNGKAPGRIVALLWILAAASLANGVAMFFFPSV
jgi:hypothetical protein